MELMIAVLAGVLAVVFANEFRAWTPAIIERLLRIAESRLPAELRDRLGEEWRSHVAEIPGDLGKLVTAAGLVRVGRRLNGGATNWVGRLFALIGYPLMVPGILVCAIALAVEQRRWPFIRSTRRMWGQEAAVWTLRVGEGKSSDFIRKSSLELVPSLLDVALGRVALPPRIILRALRNVLFGDHE